MRDTIFPGGSVGKRLNNSQWKAGIGYLVKQINHPQTQVVFAHIAGTRYSDLVAYMHPVIKKVLFRPQPLTITFSKPKKLRTLVDMTQDAKFIARDLEELYTTNL